LDRDSQVGSINWRLINLVYINSEDGSFKAFDEALFFFIHENLMEMCNISDSKL
jgi:hypothetical protein